MEDNLLVECIQERISNLREEYTTSLNQLDESQPKVLDAVLCSLQNLLKESESIKSKEIGENERYLCVSDGRNIFCLDLLDNNGSKGEPPPLQKMSCPVLEARNVLGHEYVAIMDPDLDLSPTKPDGTCIVLAGSTKLESSYLLSLGGGGELSFSDWVDENRRKFLPLLELPKFDPKCEYDPLCHRITVGDRIYARVSLRSFAVCDTATYKWELQKYEPRWVVHIFDASHVAQLLKLASAKCIGKFRQSSDETPLYVVIAIGPDGSCCNFGAAAYLVSPTGLIICSQRLPLVFVPHMHNHDGEKAILIRVEDGSQDTLCAILWGSSLFDRPAFLLVVTFTVHEHPYVGSVFPAHGGYEGWPSGYIVRVEVKNWHRYELAHGTGEWRGRANACFLSYSKPPRGHPPFRSPSPRTHISKHLRFFKWELKHFKSLEVNGTPLSEDQLHRKAVVCALVQEYSNFAEAPVCIESPSPTLKYSSCLTSSPGPPLEKGRYLCVSYGFTILCLDLKHGSGSGSGMCDDELRPFPIISTMKLLEEEIPVSMGFFQVNSETYMVGGQAFDGFCHGNPTSPWDLNLFDPLYYRYGVQGTSGTTYHLSLLECSLSLHDCNLVGPLNKPKIWPIVERIGDKIHVIESFPPTFLDHAPSPQMPSHEVLDLKDLGRGWVEVELVVPDNPYIDQTFISKHIVVGNRIYAQSLDGKLAIFDSRTNKWGRWQNNNSTMKPWRVNSDFAPRPPSINHVSQIFDFGCGRCCLTTSYSFDDYDHGLYVLIVLSYVDSSNDTRMLAEAYLVNSRGRIVCFQQLPHFFLQFNRPLHGSNGRVIHVDSVNDNEETMCAILHGTHYDPFEDFLYISTFTVEQVADYKLLLQDLLSDDEEEDDTTKLPPATQKVFVDVVVKDVWAYTKDVFTEDSHYYSDHRTAVTACFL